MSHKKSRGRCPFPKCRRRDEHDGEHTVKAKKRGNTHKNRHKLTPEMEAKKWQPGQSGNPNGRPKNDCAKQIAQAIFEQNPEAIAKAYLKLLKRGSLGAFALLSERAYGKVPQPIVGGGEGSDPINVHLDFK